MLSTCLLNLTSRDFVFGVQVDRSQSQPMDNKASLKGAWFRRVTRFEFWGFIYISGMAEARLSNFVQRETISSLAEGMTNHP